MINKMWDKIGICASGLCLIHCLATPILLFLIPSFEFSEHIDHHIHEIFAVVVVTSIMLAVYPNCRRHGHKDIIAIAFLGVVFILSAVFFRSLPEVVHHSMTITGSLLLITAHVKNMKVRHGNCSGESHSHS